MKKLMLLLLIAAAFLSIAATNKVKHLGEAYFERDLFVGDGSGTPDTVYLDSGEVDTATDVWDMRGTQFFGDANNEQILGIVTVTCADSSGTDSLDIDLNMEANYTTGSHSETWTEINEIVISNDDGAAKIVTDTVRTWLHPKYIRFNFQNDATGSGGADEKAKCYNIKWIKWPEGNRVR